MRICKFNFCDIWQYRSFLHACTWYHHMMTWHTGAFRGPQQNVPLPLRRTSFRVQSCRIITGQSVRKTSTSDYIFPCVIRCIWHVKLERRLRRLSVPPSNITRTCHWWTPCSPPSPPRPSRTSLTPSRRERAPSQSLRRHSRTVGRWVHGQFKYRMDYDVLHCNALFPTGADPPSPSPPLLSLSLYLHLQVIFNGNGYDQENQKMLTDKGLCRIDSGVEAMCRYTEPKNVKLFGEMKVEYTPQYSVGVRNQRSNTAWPDCWLIRLPALRCCLLRSALPVSQWCSTTTPEVLKSRYHFITLYCDERIIFSPVAIHLQTGCILSRNATLTFYLVRCRCAAWSTWSINTWSPLPPGQETKHPCPLWPVPSPLSKRWATSLLCSVRAWCCDQCIESKNFAPLCVYYPAYVTSCNLAVHVLSSASQQALSEIHHEGDDKKKATLARNLRLETMITWVTQRCNLLH